MTERFHELLAEACGRAGVELDRLDDGWTHVLTRAGETRVVVGHVFDLNSASTAELCNDKVALSAFLASRAVAHVPHRLVSMYVEADDESWPRVGAPGDVAAAALAGFERDGIAPPLVIKPIRGTGGDGVVLAVDPQEAATALAACLEHEGMAAVSPYLEIEREVRVVVLDGEVLCALDKERGEDFRHNLSAGGRATELPVVPDELRELALRSVGLVGLRLGVVDCVEVERAWSVLEMNKGTRLVSWSRQSDRERERAVEVYERIVAALFTTRADGLTA